MSARSRQPWHRTLVRAAQALMLMVLLAASAAAPASTLAQVRNAMAALRAGTLHPEAAAAIAQDYLDAQGPSPLAMAYLGSVRTFQSAQASAPWRRLHYMGQGLKLLDRSVARATGAAASEPAATEALLVAGVTNAAVPRVFKRRDEAVACLERLVAQPAFLGMSPANQALAHAWLAVLTRAGQADRSATHRAEAYRLDPHIADSVLKKP